MNEIMFFKLAYNEECLYIQTIHGLLYAHIKTVPTQYSGMTQCFFILSSIEMVICGLKMFLQNKVTVKSMQ
jgi:hypothetical protein